MLADESEIHLKDLKLKINEGKSNLVEHLDKILEQEHKNAQVDHINQLSSVLYLLQFHLKK